MRGASYGRRHDCFYPLFPGFGGALRVIFKVPAAVLATFTTCF